MITYHRCIGVEDSLVTRSTSIRTNSIIRPTATSHTIRVTRQTHAGPGLASAVLVYRTLGQTMHTVAKIAAFGAVFRTGSVTTTVALRMTRSACFVASLV